VRAWPPLSLARICSRAERPVQPGRGAGEARDSETQDRPGVSRVSRSTIDDA